MKKSAIFFMIAAAMPAYATVFPTGGPNIMSKDGLIQNVQNYSSNPFWDPNGPYNQRMPTPVYVQGTDLNAGDCMSVVNSMVAGVCMGRNNCVDDKLSDIRPTIMLQLSRMPGHNYATACGGYIDTAFADYVKKYTVTTPTAGAAFPGGAIPDPAATAPKYKIPNPLERKLPIAPDGTPWMQEMLDRKQELKDLQAQNGQGVAPTLARADFPTTVADLSFAERMENAAAGYEPYKNAKAYIPLKVQDDRNGFGYNGQPKEQYCKQKYAGMLATLNADLQKIQACRAAGTPLTQCQGIQGTYY